MRPNIYFKYDDAWGNADRIKTVIELANRAEGRPDLITAYLSFLDEVGHKYGPSSEMVNQELVRIDQLIGALKSVIVDKMQGNLIIVSDHGMVDLPPNQHLLLSDWLPNHQERLLFVDVGPVCSIIPKKQYYESVLNDLLFGQQAGAPFKVYTSHTLPTQWNYFNNDRIAPIIVQCDKVF